MTDKVYYRDLLEAERLERVLGVWYDSYVIYHDWVELSPVIAEAALKVGKP